MAQDDKEQLRKESSELYNAMSRHNSTFSIDDRLEAVMVYVTEGNLKEVERKTGLSYNTLKVWKMSDWWPLAIQYCHKRKDKELEMKLSRIIHDTVSEISDRIKNGDWQVRKDGHRERIPMKARDLAVIANMVYDKRAAIRGDAPLLQQKSSQEDKLKQLETKFNEFSAQLKAKTIEGEVVHE